MKKIFSILTVFSLLFLINSCRYEELAYKGDSLLLFNGPQNSDNAFVITGGGDVTYNVPFGVAKQVSADSDVTLVVDTKNSTAVEGTDFTIANKTVTLKAGSAAGTIPVKLLLSGGIQAGKQIVFKLQSNSLKNANFNQVFTLNVSLTCPVSTFVGNFSITATFIYAAGRTVSVSKSPTNNNQLIVKDFFKAGYDLILNYDPNTYAIAVPEGQSTGFIHPKYGLVSVKASSDATLASSFNPCTRVMTVYLNYYVNAGSFGNKIQSFVGN